MFMINLRNVRFRFDIVGRSKNSFLINYSIQRGSKSSNGNGKSDKFHVSNCFFFFFLEQCFFELLTFELFFVRFRDPLFLSSCSSQSPMNCSLRNLLSQNYAFLSDREAADPRNMQSERQYPEYKIALNYYCQETPVIVKSMEHVHKIMRNNTRFRNTKVLN